ncbi:calcium-binding and coiled-coil domain-containing protein 2 isoform X2 [Anguilla anguilla]|uniref:calcium-binding and coiled-coil domain-containing protein 2 isoform X2 n=1 Tax=Anguilla anguilla TaxID=7936 RepID=UPI0015ADA73C|nr:calcium-binding and coiled-coil domain-containing protein 2 isoform X2 [Anguilla anguilla]
MSQRAEGPPTSNVMEVSTYSQVVFNEVPQSYIPNSPVKCSYKLTAAIEPHRRDWVGIFKVGWSTTRDYYTFVWAAPCSNPVGEEPVEQHVTFDAYYLPKEDGEFYQFCFVDSSGQVRGASIPFRFESPAESSLDYSMDNDLLVISTQGQVEKEKEAVHKEMEKQKETINILRAELNERLLEISCLRESNVELGQSVSRLEQEQAQRETEREKEREQWASQQENERTQQERERQILDSHHGLMQEPIAQNTVGLEESMREREVLQQSVSTWQEKYQQAMTKINLLKQERAELKEKIATQEAEVTQLSSRIREMDQEKQQNLEELHKQHDHIILLQVDLQSSQKETVKLAGELRELRAQAEAAEGLCRENQALQRTLSEQDGKDREDLEKLEVKEELRKERQSSEESRRQTGRALQELKEAKEKLENLVKDFQEKDKLSSEQEKQLMDLQKILDEEVNMATIMRVEKDKLSQDNQELKRTIEKLCEEVAHLKSLSAPSPISFQHSNPYTSSHVTLGSQNPEADPLLYGNPFEAPATSSTEELLMMCRYCQEIFPDISRSELEQHEESHRVCPFCTLICDSMDQHGFEEHVYSHE